MPDPTDKAGVQRLLGLAQYLSKFLPNLSDMTKPLRELTQQYTERCWDDAQNTMLNQLKEAVTHTAILFYYNLSDKVALQCDASQSGLGAAILKKGQPVAYASRALTSAETHYAQIKKELLAIPLRGRALNSAPQRLQHMLLCLQKYNLEIRYKRGKEMFLTDTFNTAFPTTEVSEFVHELERIDYKTLLPVSGT